MGVPAAKFQKIKEQNRRSKENFLRSRPYIEFLSQTHPELNLCWEADWPTYCAPLEFFEPMPPGLIRQFFRRAIEISKSLFAPRTLYLGAPFEPYEQTSQLINPIGSQKKALEALAEKEGCGLMVLTNVAPDHPFIDVWKKEGFKVVPSFPDMVLDLPGNSFRDYLAHHKSKERNSILRNIRAFESAGFIVRRFKGKKLKEASHHLIRSYHHMYARAEVKWLRHTADYFESLSQWDDAVFVDVALNKWGQIVGFILSFDDGPRLHGGRIGVIPSQHQKDAVYFRLVYALLQRGYELEKKQVVLEPTSYRFKRYLGAQSRPLVNLIAGATPFWKCVCVLAAGIGRYVLRYLNQPERLEKHF